MQSAAITPHAPTARGLRGWDLSALAYAWTYGPLSHQLDRDLLAYLGDSVWGATVADCGCGPGIVAQKLVSQGAARVFAIDASGHMLRQIPRDYRVVPIQATMESLPLDRLRKEYAGNGFDVVLFKRSLYMDGESALTVLLNAYENLRPGGCIAIVHPEKTLSRYLFGAFPRIGRHTLYHLFNRTVSVIGEALGVESYARYTRSELFYLAASVAGMRQVEAIPSRQRAFNLIAIRRR